MSFEGSGGPAPTDESQPRSARERLAGTAAPPVRSIPIATALRRTFAAGYDGAKLKDDLLAGVVVGVVALPLSMALAIAVGAPPQHGLYTAIVAGAVVALLGGSKFQITGPTAAFIVILAPIVTKHGLSGLLVAGLMAGLLLVAMGFAGFGRLIQFIPHPVTTGFTAGIAVVIATLQIKDAFGLPIASMPESYVEKLHALWSARGQASGAELVVAASTLGLLLLVPRVTKKIPAPLIAIGVVSIAVALLHRFVPSFHVATIGSRFSATIDGKVVAGIPPIPPTPMLPWGGRPMTLEDVHQLVGPAFAIAMLGAIESLLSAVVADGMTGKKHDPNAELVGLGIGNILCPFFGGIAATGALARTATNVKAGARSPLAAVFHALLVLLAILLLAPAVAYVPMAALAGLLLLVAWNMSEAKHFAHTLRVAPRSDVLVLLSCFALTVLFDMVIAISVGVVLAALLFMKRMSDLTHTRVLDQDQHEVSRALPKGVVVYEIAGALFFGAAQNAMGALQTVAPEAKVVVLALGKVPVIDATGLVALESVLERLAATKKLVVLAGPLPEPRAVFDRAKLAEHHDHVYFAPDLDEAVAQAAALVASPPEERRRFSGDHAVAR